MIVLSCVSRLLVEFLFNQRQRNTSIFENFLILMNIDGKSYRHNPNALKIRPWNPSRVPLRSVGTLETLGTPKSLTSDLGTLLHLQRHSLRQNIDMGRPYNLYLCIWGTSIHVPTKKRKTTSTYHFGGFRQPVSSVVNTNENWFAFSVC